MKTFFFCIALWGSLSHAASYVAVVMDPTSGAVVDGVRDRQIVFPASLTKMMTLYLLFNTLKSKSIHLNTFFKVSCQASRQPPSKWGVKPFQKLSVRECILALAVRSANDIAVVVAENIAPSLKDFVQLMNRSAKKLGMTQTHFCNASGLHHPAQKTTARDMGLLVRALWTTFPQYTAFLRVSSFYHRKKRFVSTNKLLGKVPGIKIGKTGYTGPAGWNLATLVGRPKGELIVVVMGMPNGRARDAHVARLIHTFYKNPSRLSVVLRRP